MALFDGSHIRLIRRTLDGQPVCVIRALVPWRKRIYYLDPAKLEAFERRVKRANLTALLTCAVVIGLGSPRMGDDTRWLGLLVLVIPMSALLDRWIVAGLERAPLDVTALEPVDRSARDLAQARAAGAPAILFILFAGLLMTAGQVWVLVTDGVWWSWLGAVMFTTAEIAMVRWLLLLRAADREARAS